LTDSSNLETDLSVSLGRIKLSNPVITCSGTFASGMEYSKFFNISELGAVVTKSYSLEKKQGNPPPRIWETACGMINSIGLQNEGIGHFINNQLGEAKKKGAEIILSIFGYDIKEFKNIAGRIKSIARDLLALELNFSCPNVDRGGMSFCAYPDMIKMTVSEIKNILDLPLIAKLSPNFNNVRETATAAKEGGADAVSLINTITATAFDIETFKPRLASITGGLSGPAVKPIALLKVFELAGENILPIIGMGGIAGWEDAVEFMIAGASAVGIGTAFFSAPDAGKKILEGLEEYLKRKNIENVADIIGIVLKNNYEKSG